MGIGPIASLATSLISSLFSGSNNSSTPTAAASAATVKQDTSLVSPFAQILGTLQQLQQSSPAQYSQVTNQIASNLQTAAASATAGGNTAQAAQLTQLSKDFQNASSSGQLPNVEDLSKALGGRHHHHHETSSTQTTSATDPQTIIQNTLAASGLTSS
jgi:hypothetical protein